MDSKAELGIHQFITVTVMTCICVTTLLGNGLVIVTILSDAKLKAFLSNYLILSLAFTDFLMAAINMPIRIYLDGFDYSHWSYGPVLCDAYYGLFVVFGGASLLNLFGISVDRYLMITSMNYMQSRNWRHIAGIVAFAWCGALVFSISPPLLGWRNEDNFQMRVQDGECFSSLIFSYTFVGTIICFGLPLLAMHVLHILIYRKSKRRVGMYAKRQREAVSNIDPRSVSDVASGAQVDVSSIGPPSCTTVSPNEGAFRERSVTEVKRKAVGREDRVAKTLLIVTITFTLCALPYFMVKLGTPIVGRVFPWKVPFVLSVWLIFINSMLNPIIYNVFNESFRLASKKLVGKMFAFLCRSKL